MKNNFEFVLEQNAFYRFSNLGYRYKVLPIIFPTAVVPNFKIKLPLDADLSKACIKGLSVATNDANDLTDYFLQRGYTVFTPADLTKFTITLKKEEKLVFENYPLKRLSQQNSGNKFLATNFYFNTNDSFLIKTAPGNLSTSNMVCLLEFLYE